MGRPESEQEDGLELRALPTRELPRVLEELLGEAQDIEALAAARLREARRVEEEIRRRQKDRNESDAEHDAPGDHGSPGEGGTAVRVRRRRR